MKVLLTILSGFVVAVVVFSAGVVATIMLLTAKPAPVETAEASTSELWTNEPVKVDAASQPFARLPARTQPQQLQVASRDRFQTVQPGYDESAAYDDETAYDDEDLDRTTTASIPSDPLPQAVARLNSAHIDWCSQRYRSYDPRDNRYNAFSGGRRVCVSPYSEISAENDAPEQDETFIRASAEPLQQYVSAEASGGYMDSEHVQSCFARYRSYRPEDNTYQPYGGGPRRQCQ